jgi:transglutaminase-like putative cysteine protease
MNARFVIAIAAAALATSGCAGSSGGRGPAPGSAAWSQGVKTATFDAVHHFEVKVPEGAKSVKAWFALPQDDADQFVTSLSAEVPGAINVVQDAGGDSFLYVELNGADAKPFKVTEKFTITRREVRRSVDPMKTRPMTDRERREMAPHLGENTHIRMDAAVRKAAADAVGSETNPVLVARRLYDWMLTNVDYWVKDPKNKKASPVGSSEYCMNTRTGNCTDFHSLWTAMARASGLPTRMVYGSFFKKELDGKEKDQSYHCWPEFWAPGLGWVPHDVAVADLFVGDFPLDDSNRTLVNLTTAAGYNGKDQAMVDYYFGNLDERRVVWHRGRDLVLAGAVAPVNMIPKAYIEVDGVELPGSGYTRTLTFREVK